MSPVPGLPTYLRETSDGLQLSVRVQPGARREAVVGIYGDALKIAIAAPAVDGKANDALIRFLATWLSVSRSQIAIVTGLTSRSKVVRITGITADELQRKVTPTP